MIDKSLAVNFEPRASVIILADAALIHRMISNLFDNELVHLPPGSHIKIDLQVKETAILTIEDDGPGFPPEMLHNVFERHAKGRESTGHGLGLAFVDAVVRAHGGTVSARNCISGGAQICIDLPLYKLSGL
jgi:signal transduction histidine kinase